MTSGPLSNQPRPALAVLRSAEREVARRLGVARKTKHPTAREIARRLTYIRQLIQQAQACATARAAERRAFLQRLRR